MPNESTLAQAAATGKAAATTVSTTVSSLLTTKQPDTIKEIGESNNPIEILMYANVKLGKFFKSMLDKEIEINDDYFNKFNLEYRNTELKNIQKIHAYENTTMNILKAPYITELKNYLNDSTKTNILDQYIELLKHLINIEPKVGP